MQEEEEWRAWQRKQQLQREEEQHKQQQERIRKREQLLRLQREEKQRQLQLLLQREQQEQQQLLLLLQAGVSQQAACRFLREPTTRSNLGPILAILGLSETPFATGLDIKRLKNRLWRKLHPDKFQGGDSTAVMQKLQDAYDTLTEWMEEEERKAHAARNVVNLCSSDDDDDLGMCFSGGSDGRREEGVGGAW